MRYRLFWWKRRIRAYLGLPNPPLPNVPFEYYIRPESLQELTKISRKLLYLQLLKLKGMDNVGRLTLDGEPWVRDNGSLGIDKIPKE